MFDKVTLKSFVVLFVQEALTSIWTTPVDNKVKLWVQEKLYWAMIGHGLPPQSTNPDPKRSSIELYNPTGSLDLC